VTVFQARSFACKITPVELLHYLTLSLVAMGKEKDRKDAWKYMICQLSSLY
jgi:hypothetical protein